MALGALYVLLTLGVLDGALWLFYNRVKGYFDEELGRRLTAIASTIALSLDSEVIGRAADGRASDAEIGALRGFLEDVSRENGLAGVRIFDMDERDLLWPGAPAERLTVINLDPVAVAKAEAGLAAFSDTYRLEDLYFKSGYSPVIDAGGRVVAVVAAEADAAYFSMLTLIRRSLLAVSLAGLVGAAVLAVVLAGLARSVARAEEAMGRANVLATLGRMAASMAHDIRNPLGIIGGAAQRLKAMGERRRAGSEESELLAFITDEVDRLDSIVKGYLDMARPAKGTSSCDMMQIVEKALGVCSEDFAGAGLHVEMDVDKGAAPLTVKADAAQLQQAFMNVLANAREAMKSGGTLSVLVRRRGGEAHVEFRDTGQGIAAKHMRRIAEPFFSTKDGGSGLGLTIVDKVTRDSGGRLKIQSEEGIGTTVHIILPLSGE
jgi:two-component system OmpR family sensor kinase